MMLLFGERYCIRAKDDTSGHSGWFVFKICRKAGGYRAYVLESPSLNGRDSSLSKGHMLRDGNRYYVCVLGSVLTIDKMKAIARLWAKRYLRYVATGKDYNEK